MLEQCVLIKVLQFFLGCIIRERAEERRGGARTPIEVRTGVRHLFSYLSTATLLLPNLVFRCEMLTRKCVSPPPIKIDWRSYDGGS